MASLNASCRLTPTVCRLTPTDSLVHAEQREKKQGPRAGPVQGWTKLQKRRAYGSADLTEKLRRQFDHLLLRYLIFNDFNDLIHYSPPMQQRVQERNSIDLNLPANRSISRLAGVLAS
jgi:hypothetical protein